MTPKDLVTLLPLILPAFTMIVAMLIVAFFRHHLMTLLVTVVGLVCSIVAVITVPSPAGGAVTQLIVIDGYARFFVGLIYFATLVVAVLTYGYLERRDVIREEYYLLLLLSALGGAVLVASAHFASFFLGLELLSVSLYGLIAYQRTERSGLEAGLKYLILAGSTTAFLLFGMALIYGILGTMRFDEFGLAIPADGSLLVLLVGFVLTAVGIGFKLAFVPFHMWTPDVYQGAPAPVTAFLATVSKGAVFALLLRYGIRFNFYLYDPIWIAFAAMAIASMFVGNLLALLQTSLKRLLAYSSIAHLGYLLVAFLAGGEPALRAISYYLAVYFLTMLTAFGVVSVLAGSDGEPDALDDYRGLVHRRPYAAGILTAAMLSLAGIPLTGGFVAKFIVVLAGVDIRAWTLVVVLLVNSAIGLYYYLRVIVAMYMVPAEEKEPALAPALPIAGGSVLAVLAILVVWIGVDPAPVLELIERTVAKLI
jgi:NADH-quinone oxidoreductase subunit N